jgi:hypothetical protein
MNALLARFTSVNSLLTTGLTYLDSSLPLVVDRFCFAQALSGRDGRNSCAARRRSWGSSAWKNLYMASHVSLRWVAGPRPLSTVGGSVYLDAVYSDPPFAFFGVAKCQNWRLTTGRVVGEHILRRCGVLRNGRKLRFPSCAEIERWNIYRRADLCRQTSGRLAVSIQSLL